MELQSLAKWRYRTSGVIKVTLEVRGRELLPRLLKVRRGKRITLALNTRFCNNESREKCFCWPLALGSGHDMFTGS